MSSSVYFVIIKHEGFAPRTCGHRHSTEAAARTCAKSCTSVSSTHPDGARVVEVSLGADVVARYRNVSRQCEGSFSVRAGWEEVPCGAARP